MSLLIDDGLILQNTTTTNRNTIQSSGNDLVITTNNGDIQFQSTSDFIFNKNCDMVKGTITAGEYRGTNTETNINAQTGYKINLKTNNTNQVVIENTKITFTKNPSLTVATSSTTNGQLMSMNNFMTILNYTPNISTSNATGNINTTTSYGKYCTLGNIVYVLINIEISSTALASSTNAIRIILPFPAASGTVQSLTLSKLTNLNMTTVTTFFDGYGYIASGSNYLNIYYKKAATDDNVTAMTGNQTTTGTQMTFSGYYFI